MTALTEAQRIGIVEARTLARADSTEELIDALSLAESPTLAGVEDPSKLDGDTIRAAALGTLQAMAEELIRMVEDLAAELDRRGCEHRCMTGRDCGGCGCEGCGRPAAPEAVDAIWRVDENNGTAREVTHLPRRAAAVAAEQLMRDKRPAGVHFLVLPMGGCPFDIPDHVRYPEGYSAPAGS